MVVAPAGDTLRNVVPQFTIRASEIDPADRPLTLTLQLSERADFTGTATFERSGVGDTLRVGPDRPLAAGIPLYWRARARTSRGQDVISDVAGPRVTSAWARLVDPNSSRGVTLDSRRPKFIWSPAAIPSSLGTWQFVVTVENVATRQSLRIGPIRDTTVIPAVDLESNSSYRWAVTSYLASGDTSVTRSDASFVIVEPGAPTVTLLYQNFPNPFPTPTSATTCIWFDLHRPTRATVTVHDIRGGLVRTIVPNSTLSGSFLPGRYGRGGLGSNTGCDARFAWDGRGDDGNAAPTGVYLIRLKTDYSVSFKRALYRGR
ncbi:MAG: hypothetical protein ABI877_00580 [Gemmatimonadaceae bacterium]